MDESYINKLVDLSHRNINVREGDYIKDGLLHCGRCNTPKQGEYTMPWGIVKPYILCKCEIEKAEREEEERRAQELAERIRRMRKAAFRQEKLQGYTFAKDDGSNEKISTIAQRYVDNFPRLRKEGKGLLLFGEVDTGKSFIAACIVNALIDLGYPCKMTNFATIDKELWSAEEKQAYIDSFNRYSLLVIDDLGTERETSTMEETVYNVIDSRYSSGLPLIITANLTAKDLKEPADEKKARVYSRLLEMCFPIEVKGIHRRKEKLKTDFNTYKDILGL